MPAKDSRALGRVEKCLVRINLGRGRLVRCRSFVGSEKFVHWRLVILLRRGLLRFFRRGRSGRFGMSSFRPQSLRGKTGEQHERENQASHFGLFSMSWELLV